MHMKWAVLKYNEQTIVTFNEKLRIFKTLLFVGLLLQQRSIQDLDYLQNSEYIPALWAWTGNK